MHTAHCTVLTVYGSLYSEHCTVLTVQCSLYSAPVQCSRKTADCPGWVKLSDSINIAFLIFWGQYETWKGKNGVKLNFQSTWKHYISLSHKISGVLGLFAQFLYLEKKTEILTWVFLPTWFNNNCALHQNIFHTAHCTLHNPQRILHNAHGPLYNAHGKLQTVPDE